MGLPYFSPAAQRDLNEISEVIARDKPAAALAFIEKLRGQCQLLANRPEMGFRRDELARTLRVWPVGRWLIFYRQSEEDIEIVRVVHGARDLPRLFQ